MKSTLQILLLLVLAVKANGQVVSTPILSREDSSEIKKRAILRIKSDSCISNDLKNYYGEEFDNKGNLISSFGKDFGKTVYILNPIGKRIKSFTVRDLDTSLNWIATYIHDSVLKEVRYTNIMDYEELVDYGSNEKEIKRTKFYKKGNKVDSTITFYKKDSEIEIQYKDGIESESTVRIYGKSKTTETYYKEGAKNPFLIWYTYYDSQRRIVKRKQEFLDHKETTEYITKYGKKGSPDIDQLIVNGKIKSTTINCMDQHGNYVRSYFKEDNYETITDRTYNELNLEIESITETFEDGVKTATELWIHKYEFY